MRVKPEQGSKAAMRMATRLRNGEGCTERERKPDQARAVSHGPNGGVADSLGEAKEAFCQNRRPPKKQRSLSTVLANCDA
jgi:hypothetical protein